MASPSLDGSAVLATAGNATSKALPALTTAVANDLILVVISISQNTLPDVSSVTSANLTFTRRSQHKHPAAAPNTSVEVWQAVASGTLTNEVITATLSAAPDCWCLSAFGIQSYNVAKWDPNVSLPAVGDGSGATSISGVSTTNLDDLLLACYGFTSQPAPAVPSGWTSVASQTSFLGGGFSSQLVAIKSVSLAQSNLTLTTTSGGAYSVIVDAITNDAVTPSVPKPGHINVSATMG